MDSLGENRFSSLVKYAQDIIIVIDGTGTITYANPAIQQLLGYSPEEMVGENAFDLLHPDDRDEVVRRFGALVDKPGQGTDRLEHRIRHANGNWRWVESVGSNHTNAALDGYVINSRDITERVERETEIERQNERLDEFASMISHDLRNPLTVAAGELELAREECQSEHLDAVDWAHARIEELITDLLTLARFGQQVGDLEPVSLGELAEATWRTVQTEQATLVTDTDRVVTADRSRLQQLFENLFRNAVEHGGDDVTVNVGQFPDGFYVEDDGPGIPPDARDTVFKTGYSSMDMGTGFGLPIVEQVADAHDWTIQVTDRTGGGARFEITGVESPTGE